MPEFAAAFGLIKTWREGMPLEQAETDLELQPSFFSQQLFPWQQADFCEAAFGLITALSASTEEAMANIETVKQRMNFFMVS